MKLLALLLLCCPPATYTVAGNFATDIAGEVDGRPQTWGRAGSTTHVLTFENVPEGRCVKLERIVGDFVLWPTTAGAGPAVVPEGRYMGGLAGVQVYPLEGENGRADWASDETLVYVQTGTRGEVARAAFDVDLRRVENSVLRANHQLAFVQAVWLNDTGLAAHMEVTFSALRFRYVRCGEAGGAGDGWR